MNAYEVQGRVAKALTLIDYLRAGYAAASADQRPPVLSSALEAATDEDWRQIAIRAGVHEPSQQTRDVVIARIRDAEREPDPFAGLGG
jgi:hypothetical protein